MCVFGHRGQHRHRPCTRAQPGVRGSGRPPQACPARPRLAAAPLPGGPPLAALPSAAAPSALRRVAAIVAWRRQTRPRVARIGSAASHATLVRSQLSRPSLISSWSVVFDGRPPSPSRRRSDVSSCRSPSRRRSSEAAPTARLHPGCSRYLRCKGQCLLVVRLIVSTVRMVLSVTIVLVVPSTNYVVSVLLCWQVRAHQRQNAAGGIRAGLARHALLQP